MMTCLKCKRSLGHFILFIIVFILNANSSILLAIIGVVFSFCLSFPLVILLQGLRLLLHAIQQAASRHDKVIEPLLSLSIDFYARVFVRVRTSASGVKRIASRLAIVYSCTGCQVWHFSCSASLRASLF